MEIEKELRAGKEKKRRQEEQEKRLIEDAFAHEHRQVSCGLWVDWRRLLGRKCGL